MAINVKDLPLKYQAQAVKKYMEQQARRGSMPSAGAAPESPKGAKYHNKPTERVTESGAVLHFDSQKEARRYDALLLRLQAGQIRDLRLQVDFTLQEAYTDTEGSRVRAIRYRADFTYFRPKILKYATILDFNTGEWEMVVEDVKSKPTRTKEYAIKKKMLKERFGIDITEV